MRLTVLFFLVPLRLLSQATVSNFHIESSACLNETIKTQNLSSNATRYEWDFCQGDLNKLPQAQNLGSVAGNGAQGIKVIFDGNEWFGFTVSKNDNSITRIDFGATLDNIAPTTNNLGNLAGSIVEPIDIDVVYESGFWYGFVYGEGSTAILRVDFGASLTTHPSLINTVPIIYETEGDSYSGLDLVKHDGEWFIFYTRQFSLNIARLTDIQSIPNPSTDIISTGFVSDFYYMGDFKIIRHSTGNWFGYGISVGAGKLFKFSFGNNLFSIPSYQDITGLWMGTTTPIGLDIGLDHLKYYCFISTNSGLIKVDLGQGLDENIGTNLGKFSTFEQINKIELIKQNGSWTAFTSATFSDHLYRISFPNEDCGVGISNEFEPVFSFSDSGDKAITLRVFLDGINFVESHKLIAISTSIVSDIELQYFNFCLTSPVEFLPLSNQDLVSTIWSFGDNQTSTDPNPTHQYSTSGDYTVSLQVTAENGCNNYVEKTISIYDEPIPDFQIPVTSPLCTNQNYVFENTSATDSGYPVTWQWKVNSVDQASTEDLNYTFTQADNQSVTLTASIPGCENTITKPISTLTEGPLVDFSVPTIRCEDDALLFTNATQGSVSGYTWNFGDGNSSTDINTSNVYATSGVYSLTLTATNAAGCFNFNTQNIQVYAKPVVDFNTINPCDGQPTSLLDATPPPTDSNLASWQWNFDDNTNVSFLKNTQHVFATAGDYNVSLLVTTSAGCSNITEKLVTIKPTPIPDFTYTPACVGKEITFSGTSTGTITYWDWQAGGSASGGAALQEIKRTIGTSGSSSAILTVTGSNGCYGQIVKELIIPPALVPNFSVLKNCVNQETEFMDATIDAVDPIVTYLWEAPGGLTSTESPAIFSFDLTGTRNVKLTVITETGCSYTATKSVPILLGPEASFTVSHEIGGPPLEVAFTNTSSNATSFYWEFNDVVQTTSTAGSPTFTYNELGEYEAVLTAFSPQLCVSTASKIITVVIPIVDVMLTNLELQQLAGGSIKPKVTIVNNSNVPLTNVSLLLDVAGVTVREFVNSSIPAGGSLQHTVRFELPGSQGVDYFCAEAEVEDISVLDNKVCLNLEKSLTSLTPYPNPAADLISVEWISNDESNVTITLVNAMGREVKNYEVQSQLGFNPLLIDTAGMSSGVYLVRIQHKGLSKVYRIVVNK
jgi:PKD repeat protein